MELADIAAVASAVVAAVAAIIAVWQSRTARTQAVEAKRSADAAEQQLALSQRQYGVEAEAVRLRHRLEYYRLVRSYADDANTWALAAEKLAVLEGSPGMPQQVESLSNASDKLTRSWFEYLPHASSGEIHETARMIARLGSRVTFRHDNTGSLTCVLAEGSPPIGELAAAMKSRSLTVHRALTAATAEINDAVSPSQPYPA